MQVVRKKKQVFALSDSEDDVIKEDDKKDSKQSMASEKNESKKPRKEISPSKLFDKRPITRIEETKVSRNLQKVVSILYKCKRRN